MEHLSYNTWRFWLYVILFSLTAGLSAYLIPKQAGFNLKFALNEPWGYSTLVAPYDFPIYKSSDELDEEYKNLTQTMSPYFNLDTLQVVRAKNKVNQLRFDSIDVQLKREVQHQLIKGLNIIYSRGLMEFKLMQQLEDGGTESIVVIKDKYGQETKLSHVFTDVTAYQYLSELLGDDGVNAMEKKDLLSLLQSNLIYDTKKNTILKNELRAQIIPTRGLIKADQKIIEKGDIVDVETFSILNSLVKVSNEKTGTEQKGEWLRLSFAFLLMLGLYALLFIFLYRYRWRFFNSARSVLSLLSLMILMVLLVHVTVTFSTFSVFIVPVTLLPIILCSFFDSRTAFYSYIIMILVTSFYVTMPGLYILYQIVVGFVVILSMKEITQRSTLANAAAFVFLAYSICYLASIMVRYGSFESLQGMMFLYFFFNALLLLFAYALIYIVEKVFGFVSSLTLVELSNVNTPLLTQFSEQAPGSFQHVLQVSNLAVEVAKKIGANPLLTRVGALYHDVGKLYDPMLFTENQMGGGKSRLNEMPFEEAAQKVIEHVTFGITLAEKHNLPPKVIDFIRTHHSTGITKFFYNSYCNKYPDQVVDITKFQYPGPKPHTREETIVMMADSIEAVSRSMPNYDDASIDEMVDKIINSQMKEGHMDESALTFMQVARAKEVFKQKLKNMYHSRVSYPELKDKKRTVFSK